MALARSPQLALCAAALAACASGCLYWPHQQQRSPELQGVLLRQGAPVSAAAVRLSVNPASAARGRCLGDERARTDEAGRFVVPPTVEREHFIVLGDRRDVWQLCFELPGEERVTWAGSGWWGGPKVQRLSCELGEARPRRDWALPPVPEAQGPGCRELPEPAEGQQ